jgi:hypothetical protein
MMQEFKIGFHELNLGDILTLTPVFKKIKNATLEIVDHEVARNKAVLLEGICNTTFTKTPAPPCPQTNEKVHRTQRMLNALGITDVNAIPFIILKQEEIDWAKNFLKQYENPIVYTPNNSCSFDPTNYGARARTFTSEMNEIFINELSKKYTILQFGLSSKFYFNNGKGNENAAINYKNVINILDLNLRQLAACYNVIGKGLFSDTGDPFLMIAAGGKALEIVPMNLSYYPYWDYAYTDDSLWKDEKIRAKYFCMIKWQESLNYLDFNF